MAKAKSSTVVLRPKRQITLPGEICKQLGIKPGDSLEMIVEDSVLRITPNKVLAMEALEAIQNAFQRSGITEDELLETARRLREKRALEKYGSKV